MIRFSILTPAVPSRWGLVQRLWSNLSQQIGELPVEHLILMDNKRRTVGEKRDALLRIARGDYVAFVDDDDNVSDDYVAAILDAATQNPDVITFRQSVVSNGRSGEVEFRLGNPNEPFKPGEVTLRNAWHVCAWRRTLAILSHFPAVNYGEDIAFSEPLNKLAGLRQIHIPRILHRYEHDSTTSEALPEMKNA